MLERRRKRQAEEFASPALIPAVVDRAPGRLRWVPLVVLLVGLIAMVVGVARPHATITVPRGPDRFRRYSVYDLRGFKGYR